MPAGFGVSVGGRHLPWGTAGSSWSHRRVLQGKRKNREHTLCPRRGGSPLRRSWDSSLHLLRPARIPGCVPGGSLRVHLLLLMTVGEGKRETRERRPPELLCRLEFNLIVPSGGVEMSGPFGSGGPSGPSRRPACRPPAPTTATGHRNTLALRPQQLGRRPAGCRPPGPTSPSGRAGVLSEQHSGRGLFEGKGFVGPLLPLGFGFRENSAQSRLFCTPALWR